LRTASANTPARQAVIVQSDFFQETGTVTLCPVTSVDADAPLLRLHLAPSASLPLDLASWIACPSARSATPIWSG
jgi:mRNA-degrading endonuclease toxin of MazEF toxin-antitoxin module